ncbi:hypothetical protein DFJ58DRAFT_876230 [Suillus subalutaceus]|uniref:uncharacterized protein n=1 Tax=Suillus subalutaceus TaxID=48586 RepID=UPI001B8872FD|nr:uncharacterized protein DFJ58DRAFT_876230 [Suillus subalutaceus]KAG1858751.1 hypothetical protein DFJ58DRAFT_876230 [Suillus subalutaceus]
MAEDLYFPIPDVPKDCTSNPKHVWERDRGAALGETPLPSAPRSIFEYISKKEKERIKNFAASRFGPLSTSGDSSPGPSIPTPPRITHAELHVAQAALHGFRPFMTDPSKQTRRNSTHTEAWADTRGVRKRDKQVNRISCVIPSRLWSHGWAVYKCHCSGTRACTRLLHNQRGGGQYRCDGGEAEGGEVKEEAPKVHAARLGMHGAVTREVQEVESGGSGSSKRDVANIGMGEDDGQGDDVLTYEPIFASDDEESDEEKHCMDHVDEVNKPLPSTLGLDVKPPAANGAMEDVDLATFKSTFMPRESKPKDADKEKKNKKQNSCKGGTLVSLTDRDSERPRKKKRKDREGDGDQDMWVEKPPPDIVKALPITDLSPDEGGRVSGQESGPPRARKRAIDFI